jgi:hypothetical protein
MVNLLLTIGWLAFPKCKAVRFLRRLAATWQTAPNVGHLGPFGLIRESVLLNTYIGLLCPKGTRRLGTRWEKRSRRAGIPLARLAFRSISDSLALLQLRVLEVGLLLVETSFGCPRVTRNY